MTDALRFTVPLETLVRPDPRPDLREDARLWRQLLDLAWTADDARHRDSAYGVLLGLRAIGARLERGAGTLVIRKPAALSDDGWAQVRSVYLLPRADSIVAVLRDAAW